MEKKKKVIFDILSYIVVIVVVLLIKRFVVSPIRVSGGSMDNTLANGDIMILNEIIYTFTEIKRYDIVVIRHNNDYIIKRVIGLPGDRVKCEDGKFYLNGKEIEDKYAYTETRDFDEVIVPDGEYFCLGDNRVDSLDSRYFGTFKAKEIRGKATLTIFPFNRFGNKK